jgi:hypothetical protein
MSNQLNNVDFSGDSGPSFVLGSTTLTKDNIIDFLDEIGLQVSVCDDTAAFGPVDKTTRVLSKNPEFNAFLVAIAQETPGLSSSGESTGAFSINEITLDTKLTAAHSLGLEGEGSN